MASAHPLTNHDEIHAWAEERGGKPSCVKGTGGGEDVGMIRLDFPGYSGADSLQEISWDEWFQKFDESGLALLVQEETADGETSNFNKLVSRETAAESERKPSRSGRTAGRKTATKSTAAKSTRSSATAKSGTKSAAKSTKTAKAAKPARAAKTATKTAAKSSSRATAAKAKPAARSTGGRTAKSGGSARSSASGRAAKK